MRVLDGANLRHRLNSETHQYFEATHGCGTIIHAKYKVLLASDFSLSLAVKIMLLEKQLAFDDMPTDLGTNAPEQAFLNLNPFAQIPVIQDGDFVLSESIAILEYLEERYPSPRLMPAGVEDRAIVRNLMCWGTDYWPGAWKKWMAPRVPQEMAPLWTDESVALGRKEIGKHLDVLATYLSDSDWLVGEYSLADISYAPLVLILTRVGLAKEIEARPRVKDWIDRLRDRPAIKQSMVPGS